MTQHNEPSGVDSGIGHSRVWREVRPRMSDGKLPGSRLASLEGRSGSSAPALEGGTATEDSVDSPCVDTPGLTLWRTGLNRGSLRLHSL